MKVYDLFSSFPKLAPALVLGNFDGVHKAHRSLIELAKAQGSSPCAVFTFSGERAPFITTGREKLRLLEECGADIVYLCDFDRVKDMSCEDFVSRILVGRIGISSAFCGYNFTFGKGALGNSGTLCSLCRENDIPCGILPEQRIDGMPVSSTIIRALISRGDIAGAEKLLSHPLCFSGRVSHGRALGHTFGFPTLNIPLDPGRTEPPHGVYYTYCTVGGKKYPSLTNIGTRPTFSLSETVIETHLIGAEGDFYGEDAEISFIKFLRPEIRFRDAGELGRAVAADISGAKEFFGISV